MSKTPQERYDEIQKEIIEISESYIRIKQNRISLKTMKQVVENKELNAIIEHEQRHMLLLQMRLNRLIKELNESRAAGEIKIPLLYKNAINSLKRNLVESLGVEHQKEIYAELRFNLDLF